MLNLATKPTQTSKKRTITIVRDKNTTSIMTKDNNSLIKTTILTNVFKIGLVIELEKLPVHGSLVEPTVESVIS